MREEINLLTIQEKPGKKMSSFFSLSLLSFLVTVFAAIACIFYLLFLKTHLASVSNGQFQTLSSIQEFDSKRVKLLTVKERLLTIEKIMSGNQVLSQRMQILVDNIPAGFTVEDIRVDDSKISITMSSSSLFLFDTFLNTKLQEIAKNKLSGVKSIEIKSFGFSLQKTSYNAKIDFTFNTSIN